MFLRFLILAHYIHCYFHVLAVMAATLVRLHATSVEHLVWDKKLAVLHALWGVLLLQILPAQVFKLSQRKTCTSSGKNQP